MADIPNKPITRHEQYLNAIATGDSSELPTPITREEEYLDRIAKNGGGGGGYAISTTEVKTNFTYMGDDVYCKAYNIDIIATLGSGTVTFVTGETQIKKLIDSSLCIDAKIGNVYAPQVIKGFIRVTPNYGEIMWVGTSAYNISDWQNGVLILYYTKNS